MTYEPVVFGNNDEIIAAFQSGRCDVFTTDQSGLYSSRTKFEKPDDWVVLPELISKEPLGPAVRHGDNEWADVVRWAFHAANCSRHSAWRWSVSNASRMRRNSSGAWSGLYCRISSL